MDGNAPGDALVEALYRHLEPTARLILAGLVREADSEGAPLYAVGGVVRDLLREPAPASARMAQEPPFIDLDLAVDADAAAIAARVAGSLGAEMVRHDRFGTVSVRAGSARVDLARTRRERYPRPGALPVVEAATIEVDLARRDFSVNAMALGLSGPSRGALLDPFDGVRDLDRRLIRTLHRHSFRDDPTRLIRACRYVARLEGRLAPGTGRDARASMRYLAALSRDRFGEAWRRLLSDPAAGEALRQAGRLRLTEARQPGWVLPSSVVQSFAGLERADPNGDPAVRFWALCGLSLGPDVAASLPGSCTLNREERRTLADGMALRTSRGSLGRASLSDSGAASALRPRGEVAKRAAAALWRGRAGDRARQDVALWSAAVSPIGGAELVALGVAPGAAVGAWLRRLRDGVIDGEIPSGYRGEDAARRLVREQIHSVRADAFPKSARGRDEGHSQS